MREPEIMNHLPYSLMFFLMAATLILYKEYEEMLRTEQEMTI